MDNLFIIRIMIGYIHTDDSLIGIHLLFISPDELR